MNAGATVKLSQKQVALLWISEGGNPRKADEWSAIIMGESGGDTNAHENGDPHSCCHGLAQLNVEVGNASMKCALNAVCATRKSIKLSRNGRDFTPWGAYTDGSYRSYLGGSGVGDGSKAKAIDFKTPLGTIPAPGPNFDFTNPLGPLSPVNPLEGIPNVQNPFGGASLSNPLGGIEALAKSVNNISAFFVGLGELVLTPEGWVRMAKLGGGGIFILWGLRVIIRESTGTDPVKAATSTATKAAEAAAVVATVK